MGMPIPASNKSDLAVQQQRTAALRLMDEKDRIEAHIDHQLSILRMNDSTMQSPLVDSEGFPRADIDIVSVRTVNFPPFALDSISSSLNLFIIFLRQARVRVIELRNDLKALTDQIALALQDVYPPEPEDSSTAVNVDPGNLHSSVSEDTPFAMVNGVAPGSPAAQAVRS